MAIYNSKLKGYQDEIYRISKCYDDNLVYVSNLKIYLNDLKNQKDSLENNNFNLQDNVLKKLIKDNLKNELLTLYIIDFQHKKSDVFSSADYIVLFETQLGWDIYNVDKVVKKRFKKRIKEGEFFFNFEYYFSSLKTTTEPVVYCFPGIHNICITKIYKQEINDKTLSLSSKMNINLSCAEEGLIEYFLGFKKNLNPEQY